MKQDEKQGAAKKAITEDLDAIFDVLIEKGRVELEKEVFPGFTVKLKSLSTAELLSAESMVGFANDPNVARDIVQKARQVSTLSRAILAINGSDIELVGPEIKDIDNTIRRQALHERLMRLPPNRIDDIYAFYLDCVRQEEKLYLDFGKVTDGVNAF